VGQYRGAIWVVLAFAALVGLVVFFFFWRTHVTNAEARSSQRQDYALCVIQNGNRMATRQLATLNYNVLAQRIRYDPPSNRKLLKAWQADLIGYEKLLKAQRPIDCKTYVRPDLPPDRGVD
jgi:hypothetical protein